MSTCVFFGHRDSPDEIEPILKSTITNLIQHKNVRTFLVGNNGNFDSMAAGCLKSILSEYPHIKVFIVLAYAPSFSNTFLFETIYPEGLELVPKKYAISKRNYWMLNQADYVVSYVNKPCGGAAKFYSLAIRKNKPVINLSTLASI